MYVHTYIQPKRTYYTQRLHRYASFTYYIWNEHLERERERERKRKREQHNIDQT